jgi:hypothetical protein
MKDQLIFDTTQIQDSDSVGAFLRSSNGTLIDHALINTVNRLAVDATLKDGAGTALSSTLVSGKQSLDVNVTSGINVEVDLAATDDSVSSWTKDGVGTDITSTLVSGKQGLDVNIVNSLTVNDAALANTAVASNANPLDVANTAEAAVVSPLANRKYLSIYNTDNRKIYIGGAGVTAANGFPVSPGSYIEMRAGSAAPVNFVGSTGATPEIRTLELS